MEPDQEEWDLEQGEAWAGVAMQDRIAIVWDEWEETALAQVQTVIVFAQAVALMPHIKLVFPVAKSNVQNAE